MEKQYLINDENAFNKGVNAKENTTSNPSNLQSFEKSPLKPLNDATRLSGNLQDLNQEKTPYSSPYNHIRQLDSAERWIERNRVVIKEDHVVNLKNAGNILKDLVGLLPIDDVENEWMSLAAGDNSITEDTNALSSDMDELSDMLGGLDISPSLPNDTGSRISSDKSKASTKENLSPIKTPGVQEKTDFKDPDTDDDDDVIQFRTQSLVVFPNEKENVSECLEKTGHMSKMAVNDRCEADISNSPPTEIKGVENSAETRDTNIDISEMSESKSLDINDPFQTSGKVSNSPVKEFIEAIITPISESNENAADNITSSSVKVLDVDDPFKTVAKVSNSPEKESDVFQADLPLKNMDPMASGGDISEALINQKADSLPEKKSVEELGNGNFLMTGSENSPVTENGNITKPDATLSEEDLKSKSLINDFEIEDPFKSRQQIGNSPVMGRDQDPPECAVKDIEMENPFVTKTKVANSPSGGNSVEEIKSKPSDNDLEIEDPFKSRQQIGNSPVMGRDQDPPECAVKDIEMENPFVTKTKVANSPSGGNSVEEIKSKPSDNDFEIEDPFKSRQQIGNSPVVGRDQDPPECAVKDIEMENPFVTKTKVANSPSGGNSVEEIKSKPSDNDLEIEDPFKSRQQIGNSPVVGRDQDPPECAVKDIEMENPFVTKTKVANSPSGGNSVEEIKSKPSDNDLEIEDPFKSRQQIGNSPVVGRDQDPPECAVKDIEMENPFVTKTKVANSPSGGKSVEEIKSKPSDNDLEIEDPFKSRQQIGNSPVMGRDQDPPECAVKDIEMENPFVTKTKVANSPSGGNSVEEIKSKPSDNDFEIEDPFKSRQQIGNSPVVGRDQDPPECAVKDIEMENPFVTKTKIANSPSGGNSVKEIKSKPSDNDLEVEDPFKSRQQIGNSPVMGRDQDPLECPGECAVKDLEMENPFISEAKIANSPCGANSVKDFDIENPFISKGKIANSPAKESYENEVNPILTGIKDALNDNMETVPNPPAISNNELLLLEDDEVFFKSKEQIMESPKRQNTDEELWNVKSPLIDLINPEMEMLDPFQTKAKIGNSPDNKSSEGKETMIEDIPAKDSESTIEKAKECLLDLNSIPEVKEREAESTSNSVMKESDSSARSCNAEEDVSEVNEQRLKAPQQEEEHVSIDADIKKSFDSSLSRKEMKDEDLTSVDNIKISEPDDALFMDASQEASKECEGSASLQQEQDHVKTTEDILNKSAEFEDAIFEDAVDDNETNRVSNGSDFEDQRKDGVTENEVLNKSMEVDDAEFVDASEDIDANREQKGVTLEEQNNVTLKEQKNATWEFDTPQSETNLNNTFEIGDDEFVSSTTVLPVFNSPGMIEKMFKRDLKETGRDLNRGSVLLKFDPLAEKRESLFMKVGSPKPKLSRVSEIFKGSSIPSDDGVCLFGTPPKKAPRRPGISRPSKIAGESIEEETPAHEVDMILNLEANELMNQLPEQPTNTNLVDLGAVYTEGDFKKLKMDLTLHYEAIMLKKEQDFEKRLLAINGEHEKLVAELEEEKKTLTEEKTTLTTKSNTFKTKLLLTKPLFDDYGELISKLTDENKMLQSRIGFVKQENSQAKEDYKKLDKSFDDLFHRYEKMKKSLENCIENETALKKSLQESQDKLKEKVEAMKKMKEMAETKLTEQEEQIEKLTSSQKADAAKLEAVLKRKEMEVQSLKNALEQKKAENKELTELCDSLISKVSGK